MAASQSLPAIAEPVVHLPKIPVAERYAAIYIPTELETTAWSFLRLLQRYLVLAKEARQLYPVAEEDSIWHGVYLDIWKPGIVVRSTTMMLELAMVMEERSKKKKKKQKKKQRVAYKRRKTKYDKVCIYQTQQFGWS